MLLAAGSRRRQVYAVLSSHIQPQKSCLLEAQLAKQTTESTRRQEHSNVLPTALSSFFHHSTHGADVSVRGWRDIGMGAQQHCSDFQTFPVQGEFEENMCASAELQLR